MEIKFSTEYIKLQQFLKLANVVSQGSEAKFIIADGNVSVNGETETRRGRKIYSGDIIEVSGEKYKAVKEVMPE